jgi:hypothetical protein
MHPSPHPAFHRRRRIAASLALSAAFAPAFACQEPLGDSGPAVHAEALLAPEPIWTAGFDSYGPFTILSPAQHAASLTNEKLLGWDSTSVRLTTVPAPTAFGFAPGKAVVVDGLIPGATTFPPLSFGAFDGTNLPPLGSGNGRDVLILGFDAWLATIDAGPAKAYADLVAPGAAGKRQTPPLTLPPYQLIRVTVVANRSNKAVALPDFDDDGEISAAEVLGPNQSTAYYRTAAGAFGSAHPGQPAAAIDASAYTAIRWRLTQALSSGALYDRFLLANDPAAQVDGVPVLELMPGNLAAPASGGDPEDQPATVELDLTDENLEVFEPVIDPAASRQLRESFSWTTTSPWAEGPSGRPALYYAMLYVSHPEQRAVLEDAGLHWDALPLFSAELAAYDGRRGIFEHEPDDLGGQWVFAILPGAVYNVIRDEALAGNVIFDAVLRRDVPEPDALASDGSIRYEWLAAQGVTYAPAAQQDPANATPPPLEKPDYDDAEQAEQAGGQPSARRFGRRLRKFAKKVVDKAKDVVNEIRETASDVVELVAPEVDLDFQVTVMNTDSAFDRNAPMARGWVPEIGKALSLPGAELRVRQGKVLLNRAKIGKDGKAHASVIKRLRTDVCIVMANHAAELTTFLIETRICDFSGAKLGRVKGDRQVNFKLRHGYASVLAQMTDSYEYMERIEGHIMHRALVLVGRLANRFSAGASYAPCFDFFNVRLGAEGVATDVGVLTLDGVLAAFGVPPITASVVWAAEFLTGVDIVIRDEDENSRGVPTHEYGHFVMCSLMYAESLRLFSNVNADIVHKTVGGGRDKGYDVLAINEGFADFITAQVVGGFNYWAGASGTGRYSRGIFYCDPDTQSCVDDNVGGTVGSEQLTPIDPNTRLDAPLNFKAAQVLTYLIDVVDGHTGGGDKPGKGAAFDWNGSFLAPDADSIPPQNDEKVALGKGWLRAFIGVLADRRIADGPSWRLSRKEFFKALNDLIKDKSSRRKACDLCELHLDKKFCDAAGYSTFACTTFVLAAKATGVGTVTATGAGRVSPDPISCTKSGGVCTASYDTGSSVTLKATPGAGQKFVSWSGACTGASPTCTVLMDQVRNATAKFEGMPVTVKLKVQVSDDGYGGGKITSTPIGINCASSGSPAVCAMNVAVGTKITLKGSGDGDFLNWQGATCGGGSGDDFTCTFDIVKDTTITAAFWNLI